jgi:FixJ family two-component response regulator
MKAARRTLFVIEDDPRSRKAVAALASSLKFDCETFASAEAFLDRWDPSLTGCALVDFRLGGMDGLQLLDRLRDLGSALAVVLVSAYVDESIVVRAMDGGALEVIEKPYQTDALAGALRKAMDFTHPDRAPSPDRCGSH